MSDKRRECPKCRGSMDAGFLADHSQGAYSLPTFVLGPVRKKWWGIKLKGQPKFHVVTYRCSRCGFLESHATGEKGKYEY